MTEKKSQILTMIWGRSNQKNQRKIRKEPTLPTQQEKTVNNLSRTKGNQHWKTLGEEGRKAVTVSKGSWKSNRPILSYIGTGEPIGLCCIQHKVGAGSGAPWNKGIRLIFPWETWQWPKCGYWDLYHQKRWRRSEQPRTRPGHPRVELRFSLCQKLAPFSDLPTGPPTFSLCQNTPVLPPPPSQYWQQVHL